MVNARGEAVTAMKLTGDVTVVVLKNSSIDAMKPLSVQGKLHSHERVSTHCFLLTAEVFRLQSQRPTQVY